MEEPVARKRPRRPNFPHEFKIALAKKHCNPVPMWLNWPGNTALTITCCLTGEIFINEDCYGNGMKTHYSCRLLWLKPLCLLIYRSQLCRNLQPENSAVSWSFPTEYCVSGGGELTPELLCMLIVCSHSG